MDETLFEPCLERPAVPVPRLRHPQPPWEVMRPYDKPHWLKGDYKLSGGDKPSEATQEAINEILEKYAPPKPQLGQAVTYDGLKYPFPPGIPPRAANGTAYTGHGNLPFGQHEVKAAVNAQVTYCCPAAESHHNAQAFKQGKHLKPIAAPGKHEEPAPFWMDEVSEVSGIPQAVPMAAYKHEESFPPGWMDGGPGGDGEVFVDSSLSDLAKLDSTS